MIVSFVIPAYNEAKYLSLCLDSVLALKKSSPHTIEIIVVDNASTDATALIAARYKDVTVITEPIQGLAAARQAGFKAAKGELIANIDADTIVPGAWLNTALKFFENDKRLVALSGPHDFYDARPITRKWIRIFYGAAYLVYLLNAYVFRSGSLLQGGNFIVKKSALKKINGFNSDYTFYGEDADIARRLFKVGRVVFTFKLPIFASARRLKKQGALWTAAHYAAGYIWAVIFKKPLPKTSPNYR
ncbi:MAG: glycosyltransferase family A protein [Candidatus Magasanikbacteria bacterium]|nr:glycosyltransferase family A protein [Candidatus Magasanikbacteria bacterium]